jgi:hypothetical protein
MSRANGKGNIFETDVDREQRRESAEVKAEGIIRKKVERLGWTEGQPCQRPKSDPTKPARAARLRPETTLSLPRGLRPGCTREPERALLPRSIDGEKPMKPINDSPDYSLTPFSSAERSKVPVPDHFGFPFRCFGQLASTSLNKTRRTASAKR